EVVGVIPQALVDMEVSHAGLTELVVVQSMHERKARMADASDAFIALPGGYGTFEEFCEVLTWSQLGFHVKPCGVLNVGGFYDPLLALVPVPTCGVSAQRQHSRGGTVAGSRTGMRGRPGAFGRDALSLCIKTPDVRDVRRTLTLFKHRSPCCVVFHVHERRLDAVPNGRVTAVLPV